MNNKRKDKNGRVLRKGEIQRKNGLYEYRWTDVKKKRKSIYAKTLEELRKAEEKVDIEKAFGVSRGIDSLNDRIDIYLKTKSSLAKSTLENYKYYFEHSIKESTIGYMKVCDIKKSDILRFYHNLSDSGYSAGTIKILHKIIYPALQLAYDDGLIIKNPAVGCIKEYGENREKKYALTEEEEKEFLERIHMDNRIKKYLPMYAIMLKTGLRISELIGLTWGDIDFRNRRINVDHQVQYRYIDKKVEYYASDTKTKAGKRVIPMTDEVYSLFQDQRKIWFGIKKDPLFAVDDYKDFVFVSPVTGKCINHNSVRRMMRRIVDKNSTRKVALPPMSPHILRHTFCSRTAELGCDIKILQYIMGQADVKTTMLVYNHVDQDRVEREFKRLYMSRESTPNYTPNAQKLM